MASDVRRDVRSVKFIDVDLVRGVLFGRSGEIQLKYHVRADCTLAR